ncbi:hypothetical protein ACFQ58_02370 [Agromyces sp. NPDC056523]|uniref:hypothetical protein n=1 Tax=Agromyces sp. NPDC056523 TaxID=3345850 RepID=UPI00366C5EEF
MTRSMKRTGWVIAAFAGGACAVLAVIALVLAANPPPQQTSLAPWYPAANDSGDPAFADFENHVPCAVDDPPSEHCQRVKLGLVLYRDPQSNEPTTYLMSRIRVGEGDDREVDRGRWSIGQGTALDPDATVYRLETGAPEGLDLYWAIGDDILFMLDEQGMPRVGDAAYGYALNRIPLGERTVAPE